MPDVTILNARPSEEWLGLTSKTALLGHIPSSLSHQWCDLLLVVSAQDDEGATPGATWCNNPTILSDEWLRLADVAQVTDLIGEHHSAENRIITYCNRGKQSAVITTHTLSDLELTAPSAVGNNLVSFFDVPHHRAIPIPFGPIPRESLGHSRLVWELPPTLTREAIFEFRWRIQ